MVVLIILDVFLSYYLILYYFILNKSHKVKNRQSLVLKSLTNTSFIKFINKYIILVNNKLFNLGFPYGLNIKNYILVKYALSISIFLVTLKLHSSIFKSIILFILVFYIPNILIYLYKKQENKKVIIDISNIVQSLVLSLSCNVTLYEALNLSIDALSYNRFKKEIKDFIKYYKLYNFNVLKASVNILNKFQINELSLFINIIEEVQNKGGDCYVLKGFIDYLDMYKYKNSCFKNSLDTSLLVFITFLLIINSLILTIYPIFIQIIYNLDDILV